MTKSNWKLTLDPTGTPLVILDYADRLDGEIRWGNDRLTSVTPLVRAAAPILRNRGNKSFRISFGRLLDSNTDALSRAAILTALLATTLDDPKALRIEISGITDAYWQFAHAIITVRNPEKRITSQNPRHLTLVEITATTLTKTDVPPPP